MITEKFYKDILKIRLIDTYVATAFFATVVFFVLNISLYTPIEILVYISVVTLASKGFVHLIVGIIIAFFDLSKKEENLELKEKMHKIERLVNELSVQQAKIKNHKYTKEDKVDENR